MRIVCALCVGAAPEPHLALALASVAPVLDRLIVNDNSGQAQGENLRTLEASAFAQGRLEVHRHEFVDFATMRNDAFAHLRALDPAPDWVMWLDADEVHGEQVRAIAQMLERLGPEIGSVDAYTYHFTGSYRWITDAARRFSFYRYHPEFRWRNAVHEKIEGLTGKAVVLPYVYHHYGSVLDPAMYAARYRKYVTLAPHAYRPPEPGQERLENTIAHDRSRARPFSGRYPRVADGFIADRERAQAQHFARIDQLFAAHSALERTARQLRAANEALRIRLRRLEHPGLYRGPVEAI